MKASRPAEVLHESSDQAAAPRTRKSANFEIGSRRASSLPSSRYLYSFSSSKANRIGARHLRMDQRGTATLGQYCTASLQTECFRWIGAVALRHVQPRKIRNSSRCSHRPLDFNRHGNGIAVVFHQVQQRSFLAHATFKDSQIRPRWSLRLRRNIDNFSRSC